MYTKTIYTIKDEEIVEGTISFNLNFPNRIPLATIVQYVSSGMCFSNFIIGIIIDNRQEELLKLLGDDDVMWDKISNIYLYCYFIVKNKNDDIEEDIIINHPKFYIRIINFYGDIPSKYYEKASVEAIPSMLSNVSNKVRRIGLNKFFNLIDKTYPNNGYKVDENLSITDNIIDLLTGRENILLYSKSYYDVISIIIKSILEDKVGDTKNIGDLWRENRYTKFTSYRYNDIEKVVIDDEGMKVKVYKRESDLRTYNIVIKFSNNIFLENISDDVNRLTKFSLTGLLVSLLNDKKYKLLVQFLGKDKKRWRHISKILLFRRIEDRCDEVSYILNNVKIREDMLQNSDIPYCNPEVMLNFNHRIIYKIFKCRECNPQVAEYCMFSLLNRIYPNNPFYWKKVMCRNFDEPLESRDHWYDYMYKVLPLSKEGMYDLLLLITKDKHPIDVDLETYLNNNRLYIRQ